MIWSPTMPVMVLVWCVRFYRAVALLLCSVDRGFAFTPTFSFVLLLVCFSFVSFLGFFGSRDGPQIPLYIHTYIHTINYNVEFGQSTLLTFAVIWLPVSLGQVMLKSFPGHTELISWFPNTGDSYNIFRGLGWSIAVPSTIDEGCFLSRLSLAVVSGCISIWMHKVPGEWL